MSNEKCYSQAFNLEMLWKASSETRLRLEIMKYAYMTQRYAETDPDGYSRMTKLNSLYVSSYADFERTLDDIVFDMSRAPTVLTYIAVDEDMNYECKKMEEEYVSESGSYGVYDLIKACLKEVQEYSTALGELDNAVRREFFQELILQKMECVNVHMLKIVSICNKMKQVFRSERTVIYKG